MTAQSNVTDTIYNVVADIANSAFGYIYEDNAGNIGYADADHRQNYLLTNGYVDLDAGHALGSGLSTVMRSGDVRNDIYLNYGNNYASQETATDLASIALYGYKAETINSRVQGSVDAQAIADRYIIMKCIITKSDPEHIVATGYSKQYRDKPGYLEIAETFAITRALSFFGICLEDLTSKEEYEELDILVQPMNGKSIGTESSDTNTINELMKKVHYAPQSRQPAPVALPQNSLGRG